MSQEVQPSESNESGAPAGVVLGQPRIWLRLEGTAIFAAALLTYESFAHSWLLFALCFLLPDVSFVGYLGGPRIGAICYNALHTYVMPVVAGIALHFAGCSLAIPLIWIAHIGFDRMLGYGLKYNSSFGLTHLGKIGR